MIDQVESKKLLRWGFGVLLGLATFTLMSRFLIPLAMSLVLAVFLSPAQYYLEHRKRWSAPSAALLVTAVFSLGFLIPITILIVLGVNSAFELVSSSSAFTQFIDKWRQNPSESLTFLGQRMSPVLDWMGQIVPSIRERVGNALGEFAQFLGTRVADSGALFFQRVPSVLLSITIATFGIYFFLRERTRLLDLMRRNSFLEIDDTTALIAACEKTCRAVILATVISGFFQSFLFSVGCLLMGVDDVMLIAFLVFFTSFLPIVGSLPVTASIAIFQFSNGNTWTGIVLGVLAATVFVGDNLVRPLVMNDGAELHPFLAFLAALGGLQTFGVTGIFLGPAVVALAWTVFRLYTHENEKGLSS